MFVFPRKLTRKYLNKDCWLAFCLFISEARLKEIIAHAALHHEDESDEELLARGIYRYAHKHPWSWRLPLLIVIALVALIAWSVA